MAIVAKYEEDILNVSCDGRFAITRQRRSVDQSYDCLGPRNFWRAYLMIFDSF